MALVSDAEVARAGARLRRCCCLAMILGQERAGGISVGKRAEVKSRGRGRVQPRTDIVVSEA